MERLLDDPLDDNDGVAAPAPAGAESKPAEVAAAELEALAVIAKV